MAETWTVGKLLEWTTGFFRDKHLESPRLDAEVLLAHVLRCRRIDLYVMYHELVDAGDRGRFRELVQQRGSGTPAAYLVGHKEFYSLDFDVGPAVLIPRPETETIVEVALRFAQTHSVTRLIDVGAGSGILAVTLATRLPQAAVVAIDACDTALAIARGNAKRHQVEDRIQFIHSDLFAALQPEPLADLIVSNPPYIASDDIAGLSVEVRDHEPRLALDGGADGLAVIRRLIGQAADFLRDGGKLVVEIGAGQEPAVRQLLIDCARFAEIRTELDAAGHARVIHGVRRDSPGAAAGVEMA